MKPAVVVQSSKSDEELAIKGKHFTWMLQSIELLHRRFLDVITVELGRRDKALSSVQALILSHASEKPVSLGQLQSLGHYEGTNLAYNVTKLAESGYITLVRPQWDKRSSLIELTPEGHDVARLISQLIDDHAGSLEDVGLSAVELSLITGTLNKLNRAWSA